MKKIAMLFIAVFSLGVSFPSVAAMEWWKNVTIKSVGYYPFSTSWIMRLKIDSIPAGVSSFSCSKTTNELILSAWESSPHPTITPIRYSTALTAFTTGDKVDLYVDNANCSSEAGLLITGIVVSKQ